MERLLEELKKPAKHWSFTDIQEDLYRKANEETITGTKTNKTSFTSVKLSWVDHYWKSFIRQTIYGFFREKLAPTLDSLHAKFT